MNYRTRRILFTSIMAILLGGGILPRYLADSKDYGKQIVSLAFLVTALLVFVLWHFYFQYKGLFPGEIEKRKARRAEWEQKHRLLFWGRRVWIAAVVAFFSLAFGILIGIVAISFMAARERMQIIEQERRQQQIERPIEQPPASEEETAMQELDTSGWQTYRSDEFGFEVKYPNNFLKTYSDPERGLVVGWFFPVNEKGSSLKQKEITIYVGYQDFSDFDKVYFEACHPVNGWEETIRFHETEFKKSQTIGGGTESYKEITSYKAITGDDRCITLRSEFLVAKWPETKGLTPYDKQKEIEIVDQILSTFRFAGRD